MSLKIYIIPTILFLALVGTMFYNQQPDLTDANLRSKILKDDQASKDVSVKEILQHRHEQK